MKRVLSFCLVCAFTAIGVSLSNALAWDVLNSDMLLSPYWYVLKSDDQNTATELQFRAYAGEYSNKEGGVVGLVNLLTFTCSKSGHFLNFSFPPAMKVPALKGLQHMEAVRISIADHDLKNETILLGRRSGENSVYLDLSNNGDDMFGVFEEMQNRLLVLKSRVGETAINVVTQDSFKDNVEEYLSKSGLMIAKSLRTTNGVLVECSNFSGINVNSP